MNKTTISRTKATTTAESRPAKSLFESLARQLKKEDPKGYRQAMEFYFFGTRKRLPSKGELDNLILNDRL